MKKNNTEQHENNMRDNNDFLKGVRGKHYMDSRKGLRAIINKDDGTQSVQFFKEEDGSVMLDTDVKILFPDSESVNKTLRSLIS